MKAWSQPAPVLEKILLPHELFELFLTNNKMESICAKSNNYTRLKGKHMFTKTMKKLKPFVTIFLVSGYARLPSGVLGKTTRLP